MKLATLALAAAFLASAGPALAKPVYTPPGTVGSGAAAQCVVQNVGTKPRLVSTELRDATGAALSPVASTTVQPGTFQSPVAVLVPATGVTCVFDGLSATVRGYLRIVADGTTTAVLPAAK